MRSQRDAKKIVADFLRSDGIKNDFKIPDTSADGLELVRIDDGGMRPGKPPPAGDLHQKILVLAEEHASKSSGSIQ